jgi:hypothetical protein
VALSPSWKHLDSLSLSFPSSSSSFSPFLFSLPSSHFLSSLSLSLKGGAHLRKHDCGGVGWPRRRRRRPQIMLRPPSDDDVGSAAAELLVTVRQRRRRNVVAATRSSVEAATAVRNQRGHRTRRKVIMARWPLSALTLVVAALTMATTAQEDLCADGPCMHGICVAFPENG